MRLRLGSSSIFVQILALVLFSVMAAEAINFAVVLLLPDPPPAGFSVLEAARALRGLRARTPEGKPLVASVQTAPPQFASDPDPDPLQGMLRSVLVQSLGASDDRVMVKEPFDVPSLHSKVSLKVQRIEREQQFHRHLVVTVSQVNGGPMGPSEHLSMLATHALFPPFAAAYRRDDGKWAVLEPPRPFLSPWQRRMLLTFSLSALLLAPMAWWTARRLARPIHAFASAADRLGRDPGAPPLTAEGPSEVRTAVGAFNDMQDKLRRYVAERTAMVAAMAHDLRAPLMRLRFRIEAAPEEVRARAAADIEQMDAMISAALAYARGEGQSAPHTPLDFAALTASVVDDAADTGAKVTFEDRDQMLITGDALPLRRLVANLIDNAVKFAGGARVSLVAADGWALLTVEDNGPGLPPHELAKVFEPFYRPDASRDPGTGGFGLGLSAARAIARSHGGEVELTNRPEGGLRATVRLPLGG